MDFEFHAGALGAGGTIEYGNIITTIPSLASVSLAPTGGEGRSVVTNYFSEELEFSHAETRVYGRRHTLKGDPVFTTFTYVLMKDVRVFDKLRIAEMGATMSSTRGFEDDPDNAYEIVLSYRGVRIGGRDVTPRIDARLRGLTRYDQLKGLLTETRGAGPDVHALAERFNGSLDDITRLVRDRKPVQGSMVENLEGLGKPTSAKIFVPGLGTVRFGELLLKPGHRRLNLLRINFGAPQHDGPSPRALMMEAGPMDEPRDEPLSDLFNAGPTGGAVTLGTGEGNGTPIGP